MRGSLVLCCFAAISVSITGSETLPRHAFTTWQSRHLPRAMAQNLNELAGGNRDVPLFLLDDADGRAFIEAVYPPPVLRAFDNIAPGALRADLLRYCLLFALGGVYLDAKWAPQMVQHRGTASAAKLDGVAPADASFSVSPVGAGISIDARPGGSSDGVFRLSQLLSRAHFVRDLDWADTPAGEEPCNYMPTPRTAPALDPAAGHGHGERGISQHPTTHRSDADRGTMRRVHDTPQCEAHTDSVAGVVSCRKPCGSVYNALMATHPGNPLIGAAIVAAVANAHSGYYGDSPLDPTGPHLLGRLRRTLQRGCNLTLPLRDVSLASDVVSARLLSKASGNSRGRDEDVKQEPGLGGERLEFPPPTLEADGKECINDAFDLRHVLVAGLTKDGMLEPGARAIAWTAVNNGHDGDDGYTGGPKPAEGSPLALQYDGQAANGGAPPAVILREYTQYRAELSRTHGESYSRMWAGRKLYRDGSDEAKPRSLLAVGPPAVTDRWQAIAAALQGLPASFADDTGLGDVESAVTAAQESLLQIRRTELSRFPKAEWRIAP